MKNLKLLQCKPSRKIPSCVGGCMTIDVDIGTIYVVSPTHFIGFSPEAEQVVVEYSLASVGFATENDSAVIIGVEHLPELEAVCFATAKGDVILYNISVEQFECVGSVNSGLTCMAWSPDQEMVVFTTGEQTVIIMNKDFDPVTEVAIKSEQFGSDAPVNVGWGKKETQFHGSLGKEAAKASKEVAVKVGGVADDDNSPRISWRGDGQFFVINSVSSQGIRELRVWSREGCLVSTGENLNGLESTLNWRPSGNLIAATQRLPEKRQVIFFEKNGLRHGEFSLRFQQKHFKVARVVWNSDSTVLAVWMTDVKDNSNSDQDTASSDCIQLWYCSNYHWFLKQELNFLISSPEDGVSDFCWDVECSLKLHILTKGGCYTSYRFTWEITQSLGHCNENDAIVVMIDGANLLLTPMSSVVIPPPMSTHCVKTPTSINQVTFDPSCRHVVLLLSNGYVLVLKQGGSGQTEEKSAAENKSPYLVFRVRLENSNELWSGPGCLHQLTWWKPDVLVAVGRSVNDMENVLCEIRISERNGQYEASLSNLLPVEKDILRLFANVDTKSLAVECCDGSVFRYESDSDKSVLVPWSAWDGLPLVLPQPCTHVQTVAVGEEEVVIGLTEHSRLYVNGKEVANNCSSFFIHDEFLILTTSAHTLRCLSIMPKGKGLWSLLEGQQIEENVRNVERGSKIITAVTQDTKLVLQMPRGNLETIHPRVLVVSYLKKCFDSIKYKDAFVCMRRHRINLNLIYDHNPKLFLDNAETFIRQVESVTFINMFLSELKNEDVTLTLYLEHYRERGLAESSEKRSKVDAICTAVRLALEAVDATKYILCILTSYVKMTTPELETALKIVKDVKDSNNVSLANDALKYVLFLVDVNKMYDVALGMYDFQLVLMVAEKSQKDPKEYLPFLNNLRKMEENYQRYSIDKYLKRYSKAITHLAKCGAEKFNECLEVIKAQNLYKQALSLYPETSNEYKIIAECYGDYLVEQKRYDEAGLVLVRCGSYEKAVDAFVKCGNWRQVFCIAAKLSFSKERKTELSRLLAGHLKDHNRHSEAAVVLVDYAEDYEEAIECLILGHLWEESLRLMYKFERTDIIETHLKRALQEACEHCLVSLETNRMQFEKYKSRLKIVREEKEKRKVEFMENELNDEPDADLFSDTSSMTGQSTITSSSLSSRSARSSGKSVRNRRKAKRKKVSLKEGSAYEDIALMEALCEIVSFVDKMQEEVSTLLRMLVLFCFNHDASKLQRTFGVLLCLVHDSLPEIWTSQSKGTDSLTFGPSSTSNTIVTAMKSNDVIQKKDIPIAPPAPTLKKPISWRLHQLDH